LVLVQFSATQKSWAGGGTVVLPTLSDVVIDVVIEEEAQHRITTSTKSYANRGKQVSRNRNKKGTRHSGPVLLPWVAIVALGLFDSIDREYFSPLFLFLRHFILFSIKITTSRVD